MTTQYGPSYVRAIAPYLAGKPISEVAREFGLDEARIVKLASNENPLGIRSDTEIGSFLCASHRALPRRQADLRSCARVRSRRSAHREARIERKSARHQI